MNSIAFQWEKFERGKVQLNCVDQEERNENQIHNISVLRTDFSL